MGENIKVIKVAKAPDDLKVAASYIEQLCANKIGLKMDFFDARDFKTITEWMTKAKKPAEFCLSFDGDWVDCFARVGSQKNSTTQVSLSGFVSDSDKRGKILDALVANGVATASQAADFKKKHP